MAKTKSSANLTESKIFLVIGSLEIGGAEKVVSLLSQQLVEIGYKVKIILFDNIIKYKFGGEILLINAPHSNNYIVKLYRFLQRVYQLRRLFKKEKPDRIISFMEGSNFPCILTGFEVIVSVHNNPQMNTIFYKKLLIKYLYQFSNVRKVVAVSKGVEEILRNDYHVRNSATINNPIIFRNRCHITEDLTLFRPYLLSVGRLVTQKNFEMLIKAYSQSQTRNQAKLIIVGDGEEKERLQKIISQLNLQDRVFLVGEKTNVLDFYLQCEIFILSSITEGFGNVIAEALANGCACIATDCPTGPREIIRDNKNGLLVENENQEEMTKAIDRLFNDKRLQMKFKMNSKKSVEHLRVEAITEEWLRI